MTSPSRLRVAHIITQLELGGAQRNTLYTVSHIDPQRFEPCLISGPGGILDEEARATGVPCFFIPALMRPIRPFADFRACIDLYRLIRHIQPDIVHTHSSKAGVLGRIAAYLAGVPIIVHTFHGFGFTPLQKKWVRQMLIKIERFCGLLSTHLIFVSQENRDIATRERIAPKTPNSLIRSGITIQPDAPKGPLFEGDEKRQSRRSIKDKLKIPVGSWVVTYVGNFKPQKNTMDLARVAVQVLLQTNKVHFIFVGDGEERDMVKQYVNEHHFEDNIHLVGWLKRKDDIQEVLRFSNCFLLTSLWEGLPRALVEAFAARLPAVAYAVNGICDILKEGETGFPIPSGDVEQAAQRVLWLKTNADQAKAMGEKARQLILKEFDIDFMVRQQETLYTDLYQAMPLKEFYRPGEPTQPS